MKKAELPKLKGTKLDIKEATKIRDKVIEGIEEMFKQFKTQPNATEIKDKVMDHILSNTDVMYWLTRQAWPAKFFLNDALKELGLVK